MLGWCCERQYKHVLSTLTHLQQHYEMVFNCSNYWKLCCEQLLNCSSQLLIIHMSSATNKCILLTTYCRYSQILNHQLLAEHWKGLDSHVRVGNGKSCGEWWGLLGRLKRNMMKHILETINHYEHESVPKSELVETGPTILVDTVFDW